MLPEHIGPSRKSSGETTRDKTAPAAEEEGKSDKPGKSLRQTLREKAGTTGLSAVEQAADDLSRRNKAGTQVETPNQPAGTPRVGDQAIGDEVVQGEFRVGGGDRAQTQEPPVIVIDTAEMRRKQHQGPARGEQREAVRVNPLAAKAFEDGETPAHLGEIWDREVSSNRMTQAERDRRLESAKQQYQAWQDGGGEIRYQERGRPASQRREEAAPEHDRVAAADNVPGKPPEQRQGEPTSWGRRFESMMDGMFTAEQLAAMPDQAFAANWAKIRRDLEQQNKDRSRAARDEHRGKGAPRNPNTFGAIQPEVEAALELLNKAKMVDVRNRLVGELIQGARPFEEIQQDVVRAAGMADKKEGARRVRILREERMVYEVAGKAIGLFDLVREASQKMRDVYMLDQLGATDPAQKHAIDQVEAAIVRLEAGAQNRPGFRPEMTGMIREYWAATRGNWKWAVEAGGIRDERRRPSRDEWAAREIDHLTDIEAAQLLRAGAAVQEQAFGIKRARRSVEEANRRRGKGEGGDRAETNGRRTVEAAAELEHATFSRQFLRDHKLPTYVYVPETTEGGTKAVPRDMQTILYTVMQTGRAPRIEANQLARAWSEEKLAEKRRGVTLSADERRNLRGINEEDALNAKRDTVQLTPEEKQQVTQESTQAQQELVNGIIPILIMRYNERGTIKSLVGDKGGSGAIWESGFHMGFSALALLRDSQAQSALRMWMAISGRPGDNLEAADLTVEEKRFARQQKALLERRMMETYAQNVPEPSKRTKTEAMTLNDKEVSRAEAKAMQDLISAEMASQFGIDPGVEGMMRTLTMVLGGTPEFMDYRKFLGNFGYLWRGPNGQSEQAAMPIVMRPTDSSGRMFILEALRTKGVGAMLEEWRDWTYSNTAIGLMYNGMLDTNKNLTLVDQMIKGNDNFPDTETRHKEIDKMAEQMAAGEIPAITRDTLGIIKALPLHEGRGLNYKAGAGPMESFKRDTQQAIDKVTGGWRPTREQLFDIAFPLAGLIRRRRVAGNRPNTPATQANQSVTDEGVEARRRNEEEERERIRRRRQAEQED